MAAWLRFTTTTIIAEVALNGIAAFTAVASTVATRSASSATAATTSTWAWASATTWCGASAAAAIATARCTRAFAFTHAGKHFCAGRFCSGHHHFAAWWLACTAPNGLAAHGNRLSLFTWLRHEFGDDFHRNVLFGVALDGLHEAFFVQAHQVHRRAIGASTAGAADAVH
ncbi:hypothetical protein JZU48_00820, partial [bacterium]|nr:hypothetical protein [bacterium]